MKYILCTVNAVDMDAVVTQFALTVAKRYERILNMVSIECTPEVAAVVHEDSRVKYVRPDIANIKRFDVRKTTRWHLTAITNTRPVMDEMNYYSYTSQGEGVDVYVVDTGINYAHIDFEGRAFPLPGWTDIWNRNGEDEAGHGSHVAGLCIGKYSGVAPLARAYSCKVFGPGEDDATTPEEFIDICDKIILHHESKNGMRASIVNMSLGTSPSILDPYVYINDPAIDGDDYLDDAVMHLIQNGIQVCVAAGNGFYDEVNEELRGRFNAVYCRPARVNAVITVGALDQNWAVADYSNYGSCVDVFAPGSELMSADFKTGSGFVPMSGTSMASPVVAGLCALFLSKNRDATPEEVKNHIIKHSVKNALNLYSIEQSDFMVNGGAVRDGYKMFYLDLNDHEYPLVYATNEITPNRVAHSGFKDVKSAIPGTYVSRISHTVFEPK